MVFQQIKLSEYAKRMGVVYRTAQQWFYKGQIEGAYKDENGRIYVKINSFEKKEKASVVIYGRVSSHGQKADLERQMQRLRLYCASKGYDIYKEVKEVASGMNDNRTQLNRILNDTKVNKIVVEHKDSLTRFGFNHIKLLLNRLNIQIEVMNETENKKEELVNDFVSIITSFCAKLYGKRNGKEKAKELKEIIA